MGDTTPLTGTPYQLLTESANIEQAVPPGFKHLERFVIPRFPNVSARNVAFADPDATAPDVDQLVSVDGQLFAWSGSAWVDAYMHFALGPQLVYKVSDESAAGSVVIQDDDDLFVDVVAGTSWMVSAVIKYNVPTTADFQWTFAVPSGTTGDYSVNYWGNGEWRGSPAGAWTNVRASDGEDASDLHLEITGLMHIANTGQVRFRWAENGPASGTMIVRAGSWLSLQKVRAA